MHVHAQMHEIRTNDISISRTLHTRSQHLIDGVNDRVHGREVVLYEGRLLIGLGRLGLKRRSARGLRPCVCVRACVCVCDYVCVAMCVTWVCVTMCVTVCVR